MAVAGLVFGILGIAVCWWAGPALGVLIVSLSAGSSAAQGQLEISTTPIWILGLLIGVGVPLVAVGLSIGGLVKNEKKGVALVGLVLGIITALLGLVTTIVAGTGSGLLGDHFAPEGGVGDGAAEMGEFEDMRKTLDDPAFQKQMENAMKQAQQPPPSPQAAKAHGTAPQRTPEAAAPGATPSSSAPPSPGASPR